MSGPYATENTGAVLGNILQQVLGTEIDKDTDSNQTTNATTNATGTQNVAGTGTQNTNTLGTQHTEGSGTNNQTTNGVNANVGTSQGTVNNTGTNTNNLNQNTQGNSRTTGGTQSRETGTVNTFGTTNTQQNTSTIQDVLRRYSESQQTSADTAGLRDVLSRQLAGITPEMMAALFMDANKQSGNLINAQSNALGARAGSNTGVAAVLNQLQAALSGKAADINLSMLRDAGGTAANIAQYTKRVDTAGEESTRTTTEQVMNQLVSSQQTQAIDKLIDSVTNTNTVSDQNTTGVSTGTTAGTQTSTGATTNVGTNQQNVAGTNSNVSNNIAASNANTATTNNQAVTTANTSATNQNVVGHESTNTTQTVNTNVAKGLVGALAAGATVASLYNQAKASGFVGDLLAFGRSLIGAGADATLVMNQINQGNITSGSPIADIGTPLETMPVAGPIPDVPDMGDVPLELDIDGFADGGLIKPDMLIDNSNTGSARESNNDGLFDIGKLMSQAGSTGAALNGLLDLFNTSSRTADSTSTVSASRSATPEQKIDITKLTDPESRKVTTRTTGDAEGQESSMQEWKVGDVYSETGGDDQVAGYTKVVGLGQDTGIYDHYDTAGNFVRRQEVKPNTLGTFAKALVPMIASFFMPGMSMVNGVASADKGFQSGDTIGGIAGLLSAVAGGAGIAAPGSDFASAAGTAAKVGGVVNKVDKIGKADGGLVGEPADAMLNTLGIHKQPDGKLSFSGDALRHMYSVLAPNTTHRPAQAAHFADGGQISGPGTGISDSIPAQTTSGKSLRVSDDEFIMPADVVKKLGKGFFDHLIEKYHVPADMQRAIGME